MRQTKLFKDIGHLLQRLTLYLQFSRFGMHISIDRHGQP